MRIDWQHIISTVWSPDGPGESLYIEMPATDDQLNSLTNWVCHPLPAELVDLYRTCNGFGKVGAHCKIRYLVSSDQVPDFAHGIRDFFRPTHPSIASAFLPVFDWSNGDGTGYLWDTEGSLIKGLWTFEHESYRRKRNQLWTEFMFSDFDSLLELIGQT